MTNQIFQNAIVGAHRDVVKLLLDCGADVNVKDEDGENFLWAAARKWNEEKAAEYIDILKLIMAQSANKNSIEHGKYMPFGSVLESGTMEAMQLFFENDVRLDNCGVPFPLHRATANSEVEILKYLLNTRLYDIDAVDETGSTALFNAVLHKRLDSVRLLIEWGANVDVPMDFKSDHETAGRSPLSQAVSIGEIEIIDLLLSFDAKISLNCGIEDEGFFMNAFHVWSRIASLNVANPRVLLDESRIFWITLLGRAVLSQSHVQEINAEKFIPEVEDHFLSLHNFLFEEDTIRSMLSKCLLELDALKSVYFYNDGHNLVTLFDLVRGKEITRYMNNARVNHEYKLLDVCKRFPIYGNLIETRLSNAQFKRKLMDRASTNLCETLGSYFSDRDWVLCEIMTFLSIRDLRNLCEMRVKKHNSIWKTALRIFGIIFEVL
ncbi:hypothetical protein QAD02_022898 [Eretmocerus hayati]|uniref:Uncharacterized protein n=1 Tax=Eretmocerus hayati TaxID=131215 RepID=A0ACC2PUZ2_9HYME|nr:hypothetical protein QAD02_022898 [Eretmocerus hayati]